MKKLTFILFAWLLFSGFANAQTAEEIVDNVKERYQSNSSFQADVTFDIDIPETEKQTLNGKVILSGERYRFSMPNQEIISDGKTLWHWTKKDEIDEVQVSMVDEDESVITPSKVFNDFLEGFNYQLKNTMTYQGEALALIEFDVDQSSSQSDVFKVKVTVATSSYALKEMQIFMKGDGTVYTFKIDNEEAMSPEDELFTFKPSEHPETEVIDLR